MTDLGGVKPGAENDRQTAAIRGPDANLPPENEGRQRGKVGTDGCLVTS